MKKSQINYVFQRMEKKYLLSEDLYNLFLQRIEPFMSCDKYGLHTICNIYFDTDTYDLVRSSIEQPAYKEKLRLRSYGIPDSKDTVFLEIKKKFKGIVFKRRISLSMEEADNYLNYGIKPGFDSQILREIDYFIQFYSPQSKLFLAYDRIAYLGNEDETIRITFDNNIRSRTYDLDLKMGDYGEPLLSSCSSYYLMEIKVLSALPLWLARILSDLQIYPISFSKFGNVYKQDLIEKWRMIPCLQVY